MKVTLVKGILTVFSMAGFGGWLAGRGLVLFRQRWRIKRLPHQDIAKAENGEVEFQGYAWSFDSEPCVDIDANTVVAKEWIVQKLVHPGRNQTWSTLFTLRISNPIAIIDKTGAALVPLKGKNLDIGFEAHTYNFSSFNESQKRLLLDECIQIDSSFFEKNYEIEPNASDYQLIERKILLGSPLYVCGSFQKKPVGTQLSYKRALQPFLLAAESLVAQFKQKDEGYVWYTPEQYHLAFHQKARDLIATLQDKDTSSDLTLLGTFDEQFPLYINRGHEDKIIEDIGLRPFWLITGGICILVISLFIGALIVR